MKPDYLQFPNGQKFRVEANWDSFVTFCDLTGRSDLSALDDIKGIRINEVNALIWSCIKEGEEADGNKFRLSIKDISKRLNPILVGVFFEIYSKQVYAQIPEEYQTKKKSLIKMFTTRKHSE
jgi:hypothetical protein